MDDNLFILSAPSGDITPIVGGTPPPGLVPGKVGTALRLEGVDLNYQQPTTECFFDPNVCVNGLSVSLWVKFYTVGVDSVILANGAFYPGKNGLSIYQHRDGIIFIHIFDDNYLHIGKAPQGDGYNWQHIVITWEGSLSPIALYQNGCLGTEAAWKFPRPAPAAPPYDLKIGGNPNGAGLRANMALDHVLMWYDFLTPKEVWQLYVQGGQV